MLEKFPQLKRLERLLVKAQTFSPRKPKLAMSVSGAEARMEAMDTPTASYHEHEERTSYLDTFESMAEACHRPAREKKPAVVTREKSLYDSDDLLDFKKPRDVSVGKSVEKSSVKKSKAWTTLRSPRDVMQLKGCRSTRRLKRMDHSPLRPTNAIIHSKPTDSTRNRLFQRKMQEAAPSDLLCVLSEEEIEDQEVPEVSSNARTLRFPLPTMPLSIMVPVEDLPDGIVPIDFETVLEKVSSFDQRIEPLLDTRNRLATSYTLYNELCNSFQGPENLDTFLRSLVQAEAEEKPVKKAEPANSKAARSQSVPKVIKKQQPKHSLPPSIVKEGTLTCSTGSRLCRPTVSTKMKQVDSTLCRSQQHSNMLSQMSLTGSQASSYQRSTTVKEHRPKNAMRKIKKQQDQNCSTVTPPPPEEDAREDMLQRVRRGLVGLSWLGRARRNSSTQPISSPTEIPACW